MRFVGPTVAVLVLVAHAACIAARMDVWPISYYPLYSAHSPRVIVQPTPIGVTTAGQEVLLHKDGYFYPLDNRKVAYVLTMSYPSEGWPRQWITPAPRPTLQRSTQALLQLYEINRRAGKHSGQRLSAVRVGIAHWDSARPAAPISID